MNNTTKSKGTNLGKKNQVGRQKAWWGGGGIRDKGTVARMCFIYVWTCQIRYFN